MWIYRPIHRETLSHKKPSESDTFILYQDPVAQWGIGASGRILYHSVAGVKPNNSPQSDPELVEWLWRNPPSSSSTGRKITLKRASGFMCFDMTQTYLIPPRGWHQAQQPPAIGSRIGQLVVEESAIELRDCQHTIQYIHFMNTGPRGKYLIPLWSLFHGE